MFRFLMTGACAVVLTGASFAIAGATGTAVPVTITVATAAADAAPVTQAQSIRAAALEAAAPTEGADLAMWGVASDAAADGAATSAESHLNGSRLVHRFADGIIHRSTMLAVTLTRNAMRFLGVPYVFGGTSSTGFDCSGYVQHVFAMMGHAIPRTADAQFYAGKHVSGAAMVPGDLVFFQTYTAGPSHVGIYLGKSTFVHASSSHGVTVSNLHDSYWSARYIGAKRLI